eukprot:m.63735 g.63735  ORF g.63735 m.63735 type:complete len:366 (+) comp13874_c0_seq4:80-1177(+)
MAPNKSERIPANNLQALMRWSMMQGDGTEQSAEATLQQMGPERLEWLREALASLSVDIVEVVMKNVKELEAEDAADDAADKKTAALTSLTEIAEDMDNARDLFALGAFTPIVKALSSQHAGVKAHAAEAVATIVQNNPTCQQLASDAGVLDPVLALLTSSSSSANTDVNDSAAQCQLKAVRDISCLTRGHDSLRAQFLAASGIDRLGSLLQHATGPQVRGWRVLSVSMYVECMAIHSKYFIPPPSTLVSPHHVSSHQIVVKVVFLLCNLIQEQPDLKEPVVGATLETLLSILATHADADVWEQTLRLLCTASEDSSAVTARLRASPLAAALSARRSVTAAAAEADRDRFKEELEYAATLSARTTQ